MREWDVPRHGQRAREAVAEVQAGGVATLAEPAETLAPAQGLTYTVVQCNPP